MSGAGMSIPGIRHPKSWGGSYYSYLARKDVPGEASCVSVDTKDTRVSPNYKETAPVNSTSILSNAVGWFSFLSRKIAGWPGPRDFV